MPITTAAAASPSAWATRNELEALLRHLAETGLQPTRSQLLRVRLLRQMVARGE